MIGNNDYRDEGSFFYFVYSDDMFKVSGQWMSPIEVDNCIVEERAVRESDVVPLEDDEKLLKPHERFKILN